MQIKTFALLLLLGRVISVIFTVLVLKRQLFLFKLKVLPELKKIRVVLFCLGLGAFLTNLIPIAIDILTLEVDIERSTSQVNSIGVAYASNACLSNILLSIFIWTLYVLAAKTVILTERDK